MEFRFPRAVAVAVCAALLGSDRAAAQESPLVLHWPREASLLAGGLAGQILGQYRLVSMPPVTSADLDLDALPVWDRFVAGRYDPAADLLSDVLVAGVGGAMLFADAAAGLRGRGWRAFLEDAVILGEALAWSSALNLNTRAFRLHPRPLAYGSDAPESVRKAPEAAGSFYSHHAAAAFLGAAYFATVYPMRNPECGCAGWLWGGGLAAAAGVAGLRVAAGKHFPSDVVAGAVLGTAFGWVFPRLHRRASASAWSLRPAPEGWGLQAALRLSGQSFSGAASTREAFSASSGRAK